MNTTTTWNIIESFFKDDPKCLVRHHIESYNDFFSSGIYKVFKEKNPIRIQSNYDPNLARYDAETEQINPKLGYGEYRNHALLYFGGKDGSRIYFGKPVIYDEGRPHYMYPNEARLRNMTYAMTIHYDLEIEYINVLEDGETPNPVGGGEFAFESEDEEEPPYHNFKVGGEIQGGGPKTGKQPMKKPRIKKMGVTPKDISVIRELTEKSMVSKNVQKTTVIMEQIFLGKFPIMVQSDFCILGSLSSEIRFQMGECRNDIGGYFIIDGKEKVLIPQEKFADNLLDVKKEDDDLYLCSANIRSVSENVSKPIRTLSIKIVKPNSTYSNLNIVVNVPNVRKPVPLFILFRALGIISDKDIITMCIHDLHKYEDIIDLFIPSVHESSGIMTQKAAIGFMAVLTKGKTTETVLEILSDYFLPHIGELNFIKKAYFLGYMVFRLLKVHTGIEQETNRDNFKFKRIETSGVLISDLFRETYNLQQKEIKLWYEKVLFFNQDIYENNLQSLIHDHKDCLSNRIVESWFKKGFKGNWGTQTHTKRIGVLQDLNRLSHNTMLSHLRKTNLPLDSSVKLVGPRLLHATQWGFFDPIDTPDGANIGLHKHLSISTYISKGSSREPMIQWLRQKTKLKFVEECLPVVLAQETKVFINGYWAGMVEDPYHCVNYIKMFRRNGLLPIYMSVSFEIKSNIIHIYTDAGRLTRPILYKDNGLFFFENPILKQKIEDNEFVWKDLITGFNPKKTEHDPMKIYELYELYDGIDNEVNPFKYEKFIKNKAIIDYLDTSESEDVLIALDDDMGLTEYTHMEIHPSFTFGMMCNLIPFPQNNPATRNSFSCGQSKQAVSLYHTNYNLRMDKAAVVLNNPQIPLIKSRYMEYINGEENCYGENAIVAIMCYTGYNMEDAVLINEGSLKRGLFRTTYYTTYETHEEKIVGPNGKAESEKIFTNIENATNIIGTKPGYEYQHLDEHGLVREGTAVHDKMVLIGMSCMIDSKTALKKDSSKTPKKGQLGVVDKSFMTEGEEGQRIAKVRVRETRIPSIGDKMASRSGQKGTIGMIIPEEDMPFTKDGIRPDIIVNPHALPTRMTIGQLVECITGKACVIQGTFGDATAFNNKGTKITQFAEILTRHNYHSSGNEILYNGMTGEQIEMDIFVGPTYYMRLKHMVKDKINYRTQGPRTALTRQPVGGRANDGGLRIGEMERDVLISHGAANMLTESMMERGDKYFMAICNKTGMIAVYNPDKNIFLSPMADGPLKYVGSIAEGNMAVENISRFGRDFSIVRVPYSFKLLIQELQCANVVMRLITEDNIEQIENMSFSKNVNVLLNTQEDVNMKKYIEDMVQAGRQSGFKTQIKPVYQSMEDSSEVIDTDANATTNYLRVKDDREPLTETDNRVEVKEFGEEILPPPATQAAKKSRQVLENIPSPEYAPESPTYAPESPPYAPESPTYAPESPPYAPIEDSRDVYSIGETVYVKGSPVLCKVKTVGNEFITVQTERGGIQVVEPYKLTKIPPNPPKMNGGNSTEKIETPHVPNYAAVPSVNVTVINGDKIDHSKPHVGGSQTTAEKPEDIPQHQEMNGGDTIVIKKLP